MTNLVVLPDIEAVAVAWLSSRSEITAFSHNVSTEFAGRLPALQVRLLGGLPVVSRPLIAAAAAFQFDAWGTTKAQARLLASTAVGVLAVWADEQPSLTHIAVSRVGFTRMPQWQPDTTTDPPQPRYSFDATVSYRALL